MFDEVKVKTEKQVIDWISLGLLWLQTFVTIINCYYIYHEILKAVEVMNLGKEGHGLTIRLLVYHNLVLYFLAFFSLIIFYYVVSAKSTIGLALMTSVTCCEMMLATFGCMTATMYKQSFLFFVMSVLLTYSIMDALALSKMNDKVARRSKSNTTLMV